MHKLTHRRLCKTLSQFYFPNETKPRILAFQLGCITPDKNPFTYLRGYFRYRSFKGHHYPNSHVHIIRLINHLSGKRSRSIIYCFKLGQLIHYASDAFTFAHNLNFTGSLALHRLYEQELDSFFSALLSDLVINPNTRTDNLVDSFLLLHQKYQLSNPGYHTDAKYIFLICNTMLSSFAQ